MKLSTIQKILWVICGSLTVILVILLIKNYFPKKKVQNTKEDFLIMDVSNKFETDTLYVFYWNACPHCHALLSFLERYKNKINIIKYEVTENPEIFKYALNIFNLSDDTGVPFYFLNTQYLIGYNDEFNIQIEDILEKELNIKKQS